MKFKSIALLAVPALALAACSGGSDTDQPAGETNLSTIEEPLNLSGLDNGAVISNDINFDHSSELAPPPAQAPALSVNDQTFDDAAATGMTSRVDRNADAEQPAQ